MGIVAKWDVLDGQELANARAMLVQRIVEPPFPMERARVRRGPLPFYEKRSLYEVSEHAGGTPYYLVWDGASDVVALDFRSAPIHTLNERVPVRLSVPDDPAAEVKLRSDYLRFFCGMLASESRDRFLLVESPNEVPWRVPDDKPDDLSIDPIRFDRVDEQGHARFHASMLYMKSLFIVDLSLDPRNGVVMMEGDAPDRTELDLASDMKAPEGLKLLMRFLDVDTFLKRAREGALDSHHPKVLDDVLKLSGRQDLNFPIQARNVRFSELVDLSNARLGASFTLMDCKLCKGLRADDAQIDGSLTLEKVIIAPLLPAEPVEPAEPGVSASPARTIAANLDRARVEGNVRLKEVTAFGRVTLEHAVINGALEADGSTLADGVHAIDVRVEGGVSVRNTRLVRPPSDGASPTAGLDLTRARIGGHLSLSGLTLHGDLKAPNSKIEQGVGFERPESSATSRTTIDGALDLTNAEIRGLRLDAREEVRVERGLRLAGARIGSAVALACETTTLDLHDARVDGDVDLSGLVAKENVNLRDATVDGCLSLVVREPGDSSTASLQGKLDMTGLTTRHLIMGHECFVPQQNENTAPPAPPAPQTQGTRVVLDHADIALVELTSTPLVKNDTIDLRNVKVGTWDFVGKQSADERLEVFLEMLAADKDKAPSTYASIERSLFEQGFRDQAESVRKAMHLATRDRDFRSAPAAGASWLRRKTQPAIVLYRYLKHSFWAWFGYGQALVLALIFALFLGLGTMVFIPPESVRPAQIANLGGEKPSALSPPQLEETWTWGDAMWMATRAQVPMLTVAIMDQWRPADTRVRVLGVVSVSPQDYAHAVSLGSWVWWAFFLLSVTGVVKRAGLRD